MAETDDACTHAYVSVMTCDICHMIISREINVTFNQSATLNEMMQPDLPGLDETDAHCAAGYHWAPVSASVSVPVADGHRSLGVLPMAYSNVAYTYINDGEVNVEQGPLDSNTSKNLNLAGDALQCCARHLHALVIYADDDKTLHVHLVDKAAFNCVNDIHDASALLGQQRSIL